MMIVKQERERESEKREEQYGNDRSIHDIFFGLFSSLF